MGEQSADARFGTHLTHSKQDARYNASLVFFSDEESKKIRFYFFFCFIFIVLLRLLVLVSKIGIKVTMKAYFSYLHVFIG